MQIPREPWALFPDLTEDRLRTLAALIAKVRAEVKEEANFEKGDNSWGLGAKSYERIKFAIEQSQSELPWLRVIEHVGNKFAFKIGEVPMRFYTGSAEEPAPRTLVRRVPEVLQQMALFKFIEPERKADEESWFWRLAIELAGLVVSNIVVFQANDEGETRRSWSIPLDGIAPALAPVAGITRPPVKLDKTTVTPKAASAPQKKSDDDGK